MIFKIGMIERINRVLLLLFLPNKNIIEVNFMLGENTTKLMEDHETGIENFQGQSQPRSLFVAMKDMRKIDVFKEPEWVHIFEFFLVIKEHVGVFFLDLEEILDLCDALKPFIMCIFGIFNVIDQMGQHCHIFGRDLMVLDDNKDCRDQNRQNILMEVDMEGGNIGKMYIFVDQMAFPKINQNGVERGTKIDRSGRILDGKTEMGLFDILMDDNVPRV